MKALDPIVASDAWLGVMRQVLSDPERLITEADFIRMLEAATRTLDAVITQRKSQNE